MSRELTVPEPYELTLDAPGKNALSTALMRHIVDEVRSAAGRPILITGAGDTFSAGLNLKEVAGLDCPGMEDFLGLLDDADRRPRAALHRELHLGTERFVGSLDEHLRLVVVVHFEHLGCMVLAHGVPLAEILIHDHAHRRSFSPAVTGR